VTVGSNVTLWEEIATACRAAGRDPGELEVVAVTKFQPSERIRELLQNGHRLFAESRVQETDVKWPVLRQEFPDARMHLIGTLQSNKVARAVSLFDAIESVDRDKIAIALARESARQDRDLEFLVQINVGCEPQKGGVHPAAADDFIERCRDAYRLRVRGVMGVPPYDTDPRPYFDLLRDTAERHQLPVISMGMSADFTAAINAGATRLRIGRALLGERQA
jgi:PLP dependent protein